MNRIVKVVPARTMVIVLVGIGVLALTVYVAQLMTPAQVEFRIGVAPGVAGETEAFSPALDSFGLERDLKAVVQTNALTQASEAASSARDASGLERDLKEVIRSQLSAPVSVQDTSAVDTSGLERDLKEAIQIGISTQAGGEDASGLERDLKEVIRSNASASPLELDR